jgi:hypothetical protein
MIRKLTVLVMILAVAACADKTDNSKPIDFKNDKQVDPVTASSDGPQGDFRSKGEDPGAEARIAGCSFSPGHVDDRVKAGMAFQIEDKWMAKEGGFGGYGKVHKSVDTVDRNGNIVTLNLNIQGVNGAHKQICNYGDKVGTMTTACDVTATSPGAAPARGQTKTPKGCWIAWDAKHKTTSHVESGSYAMSNGRIVNAVRATRLEEGNLSCGDKSLGKGTVEAVTIYSDDVPDIEHPNCGNGTQVYYNEIAKTNSGAVVNFKKFEIISY